MNNEKNTMQYMSFNEVDSPKKSLTEAEKEMEIIENKGVISDKEKELNQKLFFILENGTKGKFLYRENNEKKIIEEEILKIDYNLKIIIFKNEKSVKIGSIYEILL